MAGAYHELKKLHYLKLIKECAQSGKSTTVHGVPRMELPIPASCAGRRSLGMRLRSESWNDRQSFR